MFIDYDDETGDYHILPDPLEHFLPIDFSDIGNFDELIAKEHEITKKEHKKDEKL